jgi:8-oxo-dGTP diphosphatase
MQKFPRPVLAVDIVVFTLIRKQRYVLLVRRSEPPFKNELALPGGFVRVKNTKEDQGEEVLEAARRELYEETHLKVPAKKFKPIGVFTKPKRDPRMRAISVAYTVSVSVKQACQVSCGDDAGSVQWEPVRALKNLFLAFDHHEIIRTALRIKNTN